MKTNRSPRFLRTELSASLAFVLAAMNSPAHAVSFDTGNPDIDISWTNSVSYTLGMRTQAQRDYIINSEAGGADLTFNQAAINTSRVDLLSEFVIKYQNNYGFRLSGDAWYDPAYAGKTPAINPILGASGYSDNVFSSYTKKYYLGPSAEVLDAFAFGKFYAGSVPINIKFGRHTLYWGEAIFSNTYAVSYSQSPVDGIKGAADPGAQIKTLFLPLTQLSMQAQLTPAVSVAGQYFFEWAPTRLPVGGTYFGPVDFLYRGPNQLPIPGFGALPQLDPLVPRNIGSNFGGVLKWNSAALQTKFGLVYRKLDDYMPWVAPQVTASGYRVVYPQDTQLLGVTASREILGASVGAEMSYRRNTALSPSGISPINNEGPAGNTLNAVLNSIWLLDKTRFYDTGTLVAELTYNHLLSVTKNAEFYNGVGYACSYKWNGCATKDFVGVALQFDPQWLQVFPSVDIDVPIFINYGLYGNAANNGGGNQAAGTYSIGVHGKWKGNYEATLSYQGFTARTHNQGMVITANGNAAYNDKGWVFLTVKAAF
jgi:hypothetical protein